MTTSTRDPEWDAWYDLQYDLTEEIKQLVDKRLKGMPPLVVAVVRIAIIESLAEWTRLVMELPKLPWKESEPAS